MTKLEKLEAARELLEKAAELLALLSALNSPCP
jgi:hypothetical protein